MLVMTGLEDEEALCLAGEVFADVFSGSLGMCDLVSVRTGKASSKLSSSSQVTESSSGVR